MERLITSPVHTQGKKHRESRTSGLKPPGESCSGPSFANTTLPACVVEKNNGEWLVIVKSRGTHQTAGPQFPEMSKGNDTYSPTPSFICDAVATISMKQLHYEPSFEKKRKAGKTQERFTSQA